MADTFDFDETLGKLAQCVANKQWLGMPQYLKKMAAHPEREEVRSTLLDTIDYLAEHGGDQFTAYTIHDLLTEIKGNTSIEGAYLQAKLVDKWGQACDAGAQSQPDSILSYLTSAASHMTADHPLAKLALPRWEALVDAQGPLTGFDLECTLAVDRDAKNEDFRHAALKRLAMLKDTEADTVFKMLNDVIDRGGFYSFREGDPESVRLIGSTLADIVDANKGKFDKKTVTDTAWKIISHCAGCDAASEQKAARIYLDIADQEADKGAAFNQYAGVIGRKNPHIAAESRDAAFRLLDLVDSGKMKPTDGNGRDEVTRCISEQIFAPAVKAETKDDALAARAAETLLRFVREELTKPDTYSAYGYYNTAQALYSYFELGDARGAEVLKLWNDALSKSHNSGDSDYYARQMGWMLDSATEKGDTLTAAMAKKEWRDTIDAIAQKFPRNAHRTVQQIVVNAVHYKPQSALLAEARAMLPDLEQRAGIQKAPEKLGSDDFLKMIGKKRQPGFKP